MTIEFYNVKKRQKVQINADDVKKVKYERPTKDGSTQVRYAFRAVDDDGVNLTKFVSKETWDGHKGKEE